MSNPSTIWTQLALGASPVGMIPFVGSDGMTLSGDVLNFFYNPLNTTLTVRDFLEIAGNTALLLAPDGYINPKTVLTNGTGIQTPASLVETTLFTFPLPAAAFSAVGQGLEFEFWGTFGADANTKTLKVYWGTGNNAFLNSVTNNGTSWKIRGKVYHQAANSQNFFCEMLAGTLLQTSNPANMNQTQSEAAIINLILTGTNGTAVAGDIQLTGASVKWID